MFILPHLFLLTDEQIMSRVKKYSDPHAFALLVRRWEKQIQRFCWRFTGDEQLGEDLAQEVFIRVFTKRKNYRGDGQFGTYVKRIAINICRDELRHRLREGKIMFNSDSTNKNTDGYVIGADNLQPDSILAKEETAELVQKALFQLPQYYREVVILRHYEGLRFREIAAVLEVPIGTVKSRMAESLNKLRCLLKPLFEEKFSIRPNLESKGKLAGKENIL